MAFRIPEPLEIKEGNAAQSYKRWRRELDVYLVASGASKKDAEEQTAIILHCAGSEVIEISEHFIFNNAADRKKPDELLKKIKEYCNPRRNEVLESFRFWNTSYNQSEPFSVFLNELRTKAEACNFTDKDRMIRDKIVFSISGKLQEELIKRQRP